MSNVLIHDLNNLLFRCMYIPDIKIDSDEPDYETLRFRMFYSIYLSIQKNNSNECILAVDSKKRWRKVFFKPYKETRIKDSKINWENLFKFYNEFKKDLKENSPFKVIEIENCEGDDVIATICMYGSSNNEYLIISKDEDFKQLYYLSNIQIYDPIKKKYIPKGSINTEEYLQTCILNGQKKDNIYNILTNTNFDILENKRPRFGEKKALKIIQSGKLDNWIKENKLEENYRRNQILMDFKKIPDSIKKSILNEYRNYELPDFYKLQYLFEKYEWSLSNFPIIEEKLRNLY